VCHDPKAGSFVTAMRIMAVIAAAFLVAAFAVATLLPPDLSLRELLAMVDRTWPPRLTMALADPVPWVWNNLVQPVLVRPAWLLPTTIGVLCAGVAATLASTGGAQRSRRRRS